MKKNAVIHITLVGLAAVALFILPNLWGWTGLPILIIAAFVTATIIMVRWHARNTGYKCPECEFTFAVSPLTDFMSPHKSGEKMLRCPRCQCSSWCFEISRASVTDDATATDGHGAPPRYSSVPLYLQIGTVVSLYIALWIVTLYGWPTASEGSSIIATIKIPLATVVLVIMQGIFCLYGAHHGYRSRIYPLVTIFVAAFLLMAIWIQYSQVRHLL